VKDYGPVWEGSGSGSTSGSRRSPPKRLFWSRLQVRSRANPADWSPFGRAEPQKSGSARLRVTFSRCTLRRARAGLCRSGRRGAVGRSRRRGLAKRGGVPGGAGGVAGGAGGARWSSRWSGQSRRRGAAGRSRRRGGRRRMHRSRSPPPELHAPGSRERGR
jgi:hypothetical protein